MSITSIAAQDMKVTRSQLIPWSSPVTNIAVDAENIKWVGHDGKLAKIYGLGLAANDGLAEGQKSLALYRGGDADIRWNSSSLRNVTGDIFDEYNYITSGAYDASKSEMWLGTSQTGVFRVKVSDSGLRLIEQLTTGSSRLRSNQINDILIDERGRVWIGTYDGLLKVENGKEDLLEKNLIFESVAANGSDIWLMGDNLLGKLSSRGDWEVIDIPARKTEGDLKDIALDGQGNVWIASEIITRYNPEADTYTVFGPAQEYTSQFATAISVDQDGAVWVGTRDKGLYVIQEADAFVAFCEIDNPVDCNGNGQDGALSVRVDGGTPPYEYEWSAGLSGQNPSGLSPGTYEVRVTDSKGNVATSSATFVDMSVKITVKQDQPADNAAANGVATVTVQQGQPEYSYKWDNGEANATATTLSPGTHTVTVTDKKGCRATASVEITEALAAFTVEAETTDISCAGGADARIELVVSGGQEPYTYQWSQEGLSGDQAADLGAGTYEVVVSDAAGNKKSILRNILEPQGMNLRTQMSAPATTGNSDGEANVRVRSGGQEPYRYNWDSGEATQQATQLSPGTHTVTVTDAKGCAATATVEITENILPLQLSLEQSSAINCFDGADARLEAIVDGGKPPYTYQWEGLSAEGATAEGLKQGSYALVVTDDAGQQARDEIVIDQPAQLTLNAIVDSPASTGNSDGQASIQASGGKEPYQYAWDSGETEALAKQLSPGQHSFTVTDANGCSATGTVDITEDILPLQLTFNTVKDLSCKGDSDAELSVEVRGGKPPYQYEWEGQEATAASIGGLGEGTYAAVVRDASGLEVRQQVEVSAPPALDITTTVDAPASTGQSDGAASIQVEGGTAPYAYRWDNGETSATVNNLSPGDHTLTVTDANGCAATATVAITEDILPLQLSLEQSSTIDCFDGANARLEANIQGGKRPYTYQWEGTSAEGEVAEGLSEGTYALVVVDNAGQRARAEMAISQPEALTTNAVVESPASTGNSDGQASIQASGGTTPYQYAWDSGETEALARQLSPGQHSFTVTDANGCNATGTVDITEDILPLQLTLNAVKSLSCKGDSDAELSVEVRGGKPPYQYEWEGQEKTTASIGGLGEGTYAVVVRDASGLEARKQGEVSAPPALDITATADAPANTGQSDGRASVQLGGGTAPYAYRWDNGATEASVNNLSPGNHSVTVTDANACTATATVEIGEDIQPLSVSINILQPVSCNESSDASLEAEVRGGKPPYTYRWVETNGEAKALTGLSAGQYSLLVQDASGLEQESSITIKAPPALQLTVTLRSPASTGNADGVAMAEVSGGTPPYTFTWTDGPTTDIAEGLSPGMKNVTVTDANGCAVEGQVEVNENILPLQLAIEEVQPVRCKDGEEGQLLAKVSGGKPPYFYNWSHNSLNSEEASGLVAGEYSLTVTDVQETEKVVTYQLTEPEKLTIKANVLSPASTGNSDGKARVTAAGGTGAYTYQWQNGATTPTAENLSPGYHRVVVTDERGCEAGTNFEVTENILPLELELALEKPLSCAGQDDAVVQAAVNGGKPPYEYQWNEEGLSGERLLQLGAGTYALTVTDVLGTTQEASLEVPALEPLAITLTENIPAFGDNTNDGEAKAAASGGTPPYQFTWDTGASGTAVEGLAIGNHSVTVTDQNNCTVSMEFETTERIMKELASGAVRSGQTMNIQKLQFDADSTSIREDARPVLNEIFQFLEQNPTIVVEIGGHTNNLPPPEYCDSLSTARARAVAEYLVRKGIESERVFYQGYGKRDPLFSNKTADGRRRNQRVEIKILRL